jgi:hypothetical protein
MFPGWISVRVKDPKHIGEWYTKHLALEVFGSQNVGHGESRALGTSDRGMAIILLPGDPLETSRAVANPLSCRRCRRGV